MMYNNFKCPYCPKVYTCNGKNLRNHLKAHEAGTIDHVCLTCDKKLSSKHSLMLHERTHDPARIMFNCALCESVFTNKYMRDTHQNKHQTKIKEYIPPSEYHFTKKPKYICYYVKNKRVIKCLGIYQNVADMADHLNKSRDLVMNLYLTGRKPGKLGESLIIKKLEPVQYDKKIILDQNIIFD